jgi:carbamoyl-phosphate synthase small subunit
MIFTGKLYPMEMTEDRKAILILRDGTYFEGAGFGATTKIEGEVVFNSNVVGHSGIITDPTYYSQILLMTYPLIGNIGVADPDARDKWNIPMNFDSDYDIYPPGQQSVSYDQHPNPKLVKCKGLVVSELCQKPSHWRLKMPLEQLLKHEGIPGIEGIDTRELMTKLREDGEMLGILQVFREGEEPDIGKLNAEVSRIQNPNEKNLVNDLSTKKSISYEQNAGTKKVVLIDLGTKMTLIRSLLNRNLAVIRVPYNLSAREIIEYQPDGVLISNGPGDPQHIGLKSTLQTIQELVQKNIPLMGIGLGSQVFSLAMGAKLYRMKLGHRSSNQPSMDLETKRCYITPQDHGFAVNAESLKQTDLTLWFLNINDKTVEGVKHKNGKAFSVEFIPEYQPGPIDANFLYEKFMELMKS